MEASKFRPRAPDRGRKIFTLTQSLPGTNSFLNPRSREGFTFFYEQRNVTFHQPISKNCKYTFLSRVTKRN